MKKEESELEIFEKIRTEPQKAVKKTYIVLIIPAIVILLIIFAKMQGNQAGKGSFVDSHTIRVEEAQYTSDYFIIATGSDVFMPPFIPVDQNSEVLTSREMLNLDYIPETVAIIGGGVIGIEFAHVFGKLGSSVTVLKLMDHILPMVDEEVSKLVKKNLKKNGVNVINRAKVQCVRDGAVYYELNGTDKSVKADVILMAVGRQPRTGGLNAEGIGIEP